MQNSLLTEDTYKRADSIYKSISEGFNPNLRDYSVCAKAHEKSVVEDGRTYKACYEAAMKIGIAASSSPGCKDVGNAIMGMAETYQEVNMARDEWLQKFRSDILYPMERRLEQDSKYVVGLRKKSQDEFKTRNSETEKAYVNLAKLRKKLGAKSLSVKNENKVQKATERLISAKAASEMVAHEMLNRAFSEERRRYCFFVDKQCDLIQAWMDYHRIAFEVLQTNLDEWKAVGASYRDLLPGAVALIESSLPRSTNISLDELDMEMSSEVRGPRISPTSTSTKSKTNLRRNESARVTGSPREVDLYNPYHQQMANSTNFQIQESPSHNDEQTDHVLVVTEQHAPETRSERLSASSAYLKSLFRNSDGSAYSEVSGVSAGVPNVEQQVTGTVRTSFDDSGISVSDAWATENDDSDTLRRNKAKSPSKDQTSDIDTISTASSKPSLDEDVSHEQQQAPPRQEVTYEAIHDFTPQAGSTKLEMKRGDILDVFDNEERGGWMYGTNRRTQQRGWFPVTYTSYMKHQTPNSTPAEPSVRDTSPAQAQLSSKQPAEQHGGVPIVREMAVDGRDLDQSPINTNVQNIQNYSAQSSPARQQPVGKKMIAGRNVFQFAKDMQNPFEEIHLRKTTANSLH